MLRLSETLHKAMIASDLRRKELEGKRKQLVDARKFVQSIANDVEKTRSVTEIVNMLGAVTWTVSIVCDVVIDTVTGGPDGKDPRMMLIRKVYDVGRKDKFSGNRYEKESKRIAQAQKVLKEALPKGTQFLADVFGNMARNTYGLVGYLQDTEMTNASLRRAIAESKRSLLRLDAEIAKIDKQLAAGAASAPPARPKAARPGNGASMRLP